MVSDNVEALQKMCCKKYGASYFHPKPELKVGISRDFARKNLPINGLRHPPEGDTTGWYFYSGEEFSQADDFFVPHHLFHLDQICPEIIKFLGLPPGWRFLVAGAYEDVWFDSRLLDI